MKNRVLICADVPGWAYHRRAVALQKNAPDDFDVTVCYHSNAPREQRFANQPLRSFDLIFNLCYMTNIERPLRQAQSNAILVISHNRDSKSRLEKWKDSYAPVMRRQGYLICNNREVWEAQGRAKRTCNISNGVDADLWDCDVAIGNRPKQVFWTGSGNPKKGKGWDEILKPMIPELKELGFQPLFRHFPTGGDFKSWCWPQEKMRETYNNSFAVVCASEHEGTPNTSLEGMMCGCALVTTRVGNALEFGSHLDNVVFCDRSVDSLIRGIQYAWAHRERLAAAARVTMLQWRYDGQSGRAQYFFQLFRALIAGRDPEPFSYADVDWREI